MSSSRKFTAAVALTFSAPLLVGAAVPAGAQEGVRQATTTRGATGEVAFDCLLQPFNSAFRYEGTASVTRTGATSGSAVELSGTLPQLPGIAPVPIEDGAMKVVLEGVVGEQAFELRGRSTVDVGSHAAVPVPATTGTVDLTGDEGTVRLTGFRFAFGKMMGIRIAADCEVSRGADLGPLSSGVTQLQKEGAPTSAALAPASTAGDRLTVVMWAVPGLVVVVALALGLRARLRRRS